VRFHYEGKADSRAIAADRSSDPALRVVVAMRMKARFGNPPVDEGSGRMAGSLVVRAAYGAIRHGLRLPDAQRVRDFRQQSRIQDEMRRSRIDVAVDVGANRGFYAMHLRMGGFKGRMLSFEPDPETYRHLENAARDDPEWFTFNCALGRSQGDLEFNTIVLDGVSTLSSPLTPMIDVPIQRSVVRVERLDAVLPEFLPDPDSRIFLKMDTQGYDLEVFAGSSGSKNIDLLQSEISVVPLYEGMPHFLESLRVFEGEGFGLLDLFVVNRMPDGRVLEYDCLMRRT